MLSLLLIAIAAAIVVWWRAAARRSTERILIVGLTPLTEQIARDIASRPGCGADIVGVVDNQRDPTCALSGSPYFGPLSRLVEIAAELRADRIVIALSERRGRTPIRALLDCCVSRGIFLEDAVEFYERVTGKLAIESLTPMNILFSGKFRRSRSQEAFARIMSLMIVIVALIGLAPLLLVIPLAIKLDSPGPVLFVQRRVGLYGRPFNLLKFRTMRIGPRTSEWAGDNLQHVTRVGRWLRAWRLDELPQFVNILHGDMNFVGPRPHPVTNFELLTLVARNLTEMTGIALACYTLRSMVRPGLTGWAQVRYGYANNLEQEIEKLRFDLFYVKHKSAWLDCRILLETAKVMCLGRLQDGIRIPRVAPHDGGTRSAHQAVDTAAPHASPVLPPAIHDAERTWYHA